MIYRTTTYYKIRDMKAKICVVQGGQGAGKNFGIAQILKEEAEKEPLLITIMSDTYDNLKDGAILDFKNLWADSGLIWDNDYHGTDKNLTHHNSVIQFRYISDTKPDAGKSKRRDILYLNEANKFGWNIASTYIGRTHKKVYIDHNPDFEYWAHTEIPKLLDKDGNRMDEQIIVTYRDNEMCPQSEVDHIEARRGNKIWYNVYGLGLTGTYSDRRIYSYEWIDEMHQSIKGRLTELEQQVIGKAKRINSGMDFGLSPDPTILVDLYIDGINLIADERFCENNLMPEKITGAERMSVVDKLDEIGFMKGQMIIGDTDGKTSLYDMRRHGYNCIAVKKLMGMKKEGIGKIGSYNLLLTRRSVNIKKGIEQWFRKIDHNGKIIQEPDGHEPDGLAAIRYGIMTYINKAA